jgi:hypothetical protein
MELSQIVPARDETILPPWFSAALGGATLRVNPPLSIFVRN